MKKNAYVAITLSVVMLAGMLYVLAGQGTIVRAQIDSERERGQMRASELRGKFGEDFKDLEKNFSRIFDRFSNMPPAEVPASISVNPEGDVRLTGAEVTALPGTQITVKLWGWNFTVDRSNAQIIGRVNLPTTVAPTNMEVSTVPGADINVGDKLLIRGTVNSATGVVTASWIRNLSLQQRGVADIQGRINQLLQLLQQLQAQLRARTGGN